MTKEFFLLTPVLNIFWLLIILFLVTIFLLVLEWFRPRHFIFYRLFAVCVAMLSLAMLLLRPSYLTNEKSDQYLILTPNYRTSVVDSLLQAHPELMVVSFGDSSNRQASTQIQTRQQLKELDGKIAFIAGEGLSKTYFNLLQNKTFHYFPAQKPVGIIELSLPAFAYPGQVSNIKGKLNTEELTTLQLIDPGGKIDSIVFKETGEQSFDFKVMNKQAGNILYTLKTLTSSSEEIFNIPLKVRKPEKLEILMLQLAPSFEMRQLKNFLSGQGHGIQVRSRVSESNFSYEKVNTELKQTITITDEVLQKYDLLILENSTLEQLSRIESEAITRAIQAGLGVLLLIDQSENKNKSAKSITDFSLTNDDRDTVHLSLNGSSKKHVIKKQRHVITPKQEVLPVLVSSEKILAAYRYLRSGKVAVQLLNETYQLRLSGDSTAYTAIWSDLISGSSRRKPASTEISTTDEFPHTPDASIALQIIANDEQPVLHYQGQIVPVMEDVLIDNLWRATLRPQKTGWHSVLLRDSTQYEFYVSGEDEWLALRRQQQINLHQAETIEPNDLRNEKVRRYQDIPSYLFYLTFLLSMAFLWLAPKL